MLCPVPPGFPAPQPRGPPAQSGDGCTPPQQPVPCSFAQLLLSLGTAWLLDAAPRVHYLPILERAGGQGPVFPSRAHYWRQRLAYSRCSVKTVETANVTLCVSGYVCVAVCMSAPTVGGFLPLGAISRHTSNKQSLQDVRQVCSQVGCTEGTLPLESRCVVRWVAWGGPLALKAGM